MTLKDDKMTIKDLKPGMSCTLLTMRKRGNYQSDSSIAHIRGNDVYVDVVIVDNKIVNFGHISNFLIINIAGQRPQIFQYIIPEICKEGSRRYYKISLKNKSSTVYDRRKNFRLRINKSVKAKFDDNASTNRGVIKNISAVGFAIVVDKTNLPKDHMNTKKIFTVLKDGEPEYGLQYTFELKGEVRRIVNTNDGKVLFGCQFPYSHRVEKYIHEKELIKRKKDKR